MPGPSDVAANADNGEESAAGAVAVVRDPAGNAAAAPAEMLCVQRIAVRRTVDALAPLLDGQASATPVCAMLAAVHCAAAHRMPLSVACC